MKKLHESSWFSFWLRCELLTGSMHKVERRGNDPVGGCISLQLHSDLTIHLAVDAGNQNGLPDARLTSETNKYIVRK
jgi:hypothetical protein